MPVLNDKPDIVRRQSNVHMHPSIVINLCSSIVRIVSAEYYSGQISNGRHPGGHSSADTIALKELRRPAVKNEYAASTL